MALYNGMKIIPKVEINDKESALVVYSSILEDVCTKIQKDNELSFDYTNRENSVAVISFDYKKSLERAIFLKSALSIDAYPFEISSSEKEKIKLVVENIELTFGAVDLSLIQEEVKDIEFDVNIPVLKENVSDLKKFFLCVSKNLFMFSFDNLNGDIIDKSFQIRKMAGGLVETAIIEEKHIKPICLVSDGSNIFTIGNVGALASLPVLESKSVLYNIYGDICALPLAIKSQDSNIIAEVINLLKNSFSSINLTNMQVKTSFEVENILKNQNIHKIYNDEETSKPIVVLAGLLNALHLANKQIENAKILISGYSLLENELCKLLVSVGAKHLILFDENGSVYSSRENNTLLQEEILKYTTFNQFKGSLQDAITSCDVFVSLDRQNTFIHQNISKMNEKPIIFSLENFNKETLENSFIYSTSKQIDNSLVSIILQNNFENMKTNNKLNCAFALASLVKDDELSQDYILPDALDSQVVKTILDNVI